MKKAALIALLLAALTGCKFNEDQVSTDDIQKGLLFGDCVRGCYNSVYGENVQP